MPRSLLFICAVPLLLSPLVHAGDDPLYAKNLSPVAGLFGLPSARAAGTVAGGANLFAVHSSIASHYIEETEGDLKLGEPNSWPEPFGYRGDDAPGLIEVAEGHKVRAMA